MAIAIAALVQAPAPSVPTSSAAPASSAMPASSSPAAPASAAPPGTAPVPAAPASPSSLGDATVTAAPNATAPAESGAARRCLDTYRFVNGHCVPCEPACSSGTVCGDDGRCTPIVCPQDSVLIDNRCIALKRVFGPDNRECNPPCDETHVCGPDGRCVRYRPPSPSDYSHDGPYVRFAAGVGSATLGRKGDPNVTGRDPGNSGRLARLHVSVIRDQATSAVRVISPIPVR